MYYRLASHVPKLQLLRLALGCWAKCLYVPGVHHLMLCYLFDYAARQQTFLGRMDLYLRLFSRSAHIMDVLTRNFMQTSWMISMLYICPVLIRNLQLCGDNQCAACFQVVPMFISAFWCQCLLADSQSLLTRLAGLLLASQVPAV